ncbi:MAG: GNAT family N-acetyltransferase [Paraglaciecola sp.]|nr:GNAT family N-acetyltransferase [Paraglaciecola sp.]
MEFFVAQKADQVVGFLLAIKDEHWFSNSSYGTDFAFCVLPDHAEQGVWLLRRFIRWCKAFNIPMMMGLSTGMDVDGRTGKMYEMHGLPRVGGIHATIKQVLK